jgi:carbonic anhydrase
MRGFMNSDIKKILEDNKKWAGGMKKVEPEFFSKLAEQQNPKFLWIGCADSRVPANEIIGKQPGEVFVHRNIANVVVHSDLNCLSVIQYAVEVLKVEHIILCGHYGCGGIAAAMGDEEFGLIDNWLRHIKDIYRFHKQKLDALNSHEERVRLMCELNVIEQVENICNTTVFHNAEKRSQKLEIHGMIYSLEDGILKNIINRTI